VTFGALGARGYNEKRQLSTIPDLTSRWERSQSANGLRFSFPARRNKKNEGRMSRIAGGFYLCGSINLASLFRVLQKTPPDRQPGAFFQRIPPQSMKKIIVAIDGYSACGKSTTAKKVAEKLRYTYIDSGAMYRAVTLYFHQNYVTLTHPREVAEALQTIQIQFKYNSKTEKSETYLNGLNVEEEIRRMYISENVSEVSAVPEVRKALVALQQKMGSKRGVVMDGRDIGTKVFPDAELKIFMNADMTVRAHRRQLELMERGDIVDLEDIIENLKHRDHLDTTRKESPLIQAPDAYLLDTTYITVDEQIEFVVNLAISKMIEKEKKSTDSGSSAE